MCLSQYFLVILAGLLSVYCLWKTGSWETSSVRASIQFDLSLPISPSAMPERILNKRNKGSIDKLYRRYQGTLSKYMIQLYHRKPDADIIRALAPIHVSVPAQDGRRILVFSVPPVDPDEILVLAELLSTVGTILRIRSTDLNNEIEEDNCRTRKDESWRAFNVTAAVTSRNSNLVKLYVYGRVGYRPCGDGPILLLNYSKAKKRRARRSISDQEDREENSVRWEEEGPRRRRRNSCRRRPLYVDFSLIAYDEWVVAPPGYEAYQCVGKCFYPFGDHLSPTKHAIVQTLVHGALQGIEGLAGSKSVGRACCVPTRLAPTSLLYLDASGTLTYQYGYEDMVVVECGCR